MASYCGVNLRFFNHEEHEFSRMGSGVAGEFDYRFYLHDAEQALIIDTEAPKITPLH